MNSSPRGLPKRTANRSAQAISVFLLLVLFLQTITFGQTEQQTASQALIHAVYELDFKKVKKALDEGADPNATDQHGRPALILASGNALDLFSGPVANEDIVRLLLSKGANPNAKLSDDPVGIGATPLLGAVQFRKHGIAKLLLDNGADPQLPDVRGTTPLCAAASTHDIEMISLLLERGVDPNPKDGARCHPLSSCLDNARSELERESAKRCLDRLLDAKSNPNLAVSTDTPLMTAARWRTPDILQLLLNRGARVDAEAEDGRTALFVAQTFENKELLFRNGADANHRSKNGETPLMTATAKEEVELLLRHGARLDDVDNKNLTALAHAASIANTEVVATLLAHRSSVELKTKSGDTLLHLVFPDRLGSENDSAIRDTASSLIRAGVKVNQKNNNGDAPIHLAGAFGTPSVIQLLARNGADLLVKNGAGKTPLDRATEAANEEGALLLRDLTSPKSPPTAANLPLSFWSQFDTAQTEGHRIPVPADPDPVRRALLQDLAYDLMKIGASESIDNLRSFWQKMPEADRERLFREHRKVFSSYDPLRSVFADSRFGLREDGDAQARTLFTRYERDRQPQKAVPDSEDALKNLNLDNGPLTALSLSHMASAIPKSLGTKPAVMKQAALHSLLFGTFLHLYPNPASAEKEVGYDEARKYFEQRIRIIGSDLLKLYRAQRPLLEKTFSPRPMPPLEISFQVSRSQTQASVDTSTAKPTRYASISYRDIVDSFHAGVADGLAPLMQSDDLEEDDYLAAFWSTLPKDIEIFGNVSSSSNDKSPPLSRQDVIKNVQTIQLELSRAQPLSLHDLAVQGPVQKTLADLLSALGRSRPQKKDMPAFLKPFAKKFEALKKHYDEQLAEDDSEAVFRWFGNYAKNAFLYDASRKVETQFNNVIQFALAHEIGHHVFGTAEIHDQQAEDDADAFAVTLLTGAYVHLSLTDLTVLNQRNQKTGTRLVVLDGNALRQYIGYPIYFGSRLRERGSHTPLWSDHRTPEDRIKLLTDQFRSVYRVLQNKIFAERTQTYRRRQVSRDVLDEFTSVVTVVSGRTVKKQR